MIVVTKHTIDMRQKRMLNQTANEAQIISNGKQGANHLDEVVVLEKQTC
jgi:hypothetical protein